MGNELDPVVGQWYRHRDKGEMFRVVAVDSATGSIELQSFDGDVEEMDADAWRELDVEESGEPEDSSAPFDDIETDDLGAGETAMTPADWRLSLEPALAAEEGWQNLGMPDEPEEQEEGRSG